VDAEKWGCLSQNQFFGIQSKNHILVYILILQSVFISSHVRVSCNTLICISPRCVVWRDSVVVALFALFHCDCVVFVFMLSHDRSETFWLQTLASCSCLAGPREGYV
jgi:hypothetical protein